MSQERAFLVLLGDIRSPQDVDDGIDDRIHTYGTCHVVLPEYAFCSLIVDLVLTDY